MNKVTLYRNDEPVGEFEYLRKWEAVSGVGARMTGNPKYYYDLKIPEERKLGRDFGGIWMIEVDGNRYPVSVAGCCDFMGDSLLVLTR